MTLPTRIDVTPLWAAGLVLLLTLPALAAPVQSCGPAVCYAWDDDPALNPGILHFGAPRLLAGSDVVEFTPGGFMVAAGGPAGSQSRVAGFRFSEVWSHPGHEIASIAVTASGDHQLFGGGSASAALYVEVNDLDDDEGSALFPERTSGSDSVTLTTPTGFPFAAWSLGATADPALFFDDPALRIDLLLRATFEVGAGAPGEYAVLAGKLFLVSPTTAAVPAPPALWLMISGVAGLALRRHRRNRPAASRAGGATGWCRERDLNPHGVSTSGF